MSLDSGWPAILVHGESATTSKWGNAWKKVMDHFGNISMTLTSTDDYLDIDNFLKTGQYQGWIWRLT